MFSRISRLLSRDMYIALLAVAFGIFGFTGAGPEPWAVVVALIGGAILTCDWLIGWMFYPAPYARGLLSREPLRRSFLRRSLVPLALGFLAFCVYMPVTFLVRFAVSYPALMHYVHAAQTQPPGNFVIPKADFDRESPNEKLWDRAKNPMPGWVGLIYIDSVYVLRNGDVQMHTTDCGVLGQAGITYSPDSQFYHYNEWMSRDTFIHIFGPWYLWRFD